MGFVVRREIKNKDGKVKKNKAPKIQRLVTPSLLQRKRFFRSQTRNSMVLSKKLKTTTRSGSQSTSTSRGSCAPPRWPRKRRRRRERGGSEASTHPLSADEK